MYRVDIYTDSLAVVYFKGHQQVRPVQLTSPMWVPGKVSFESLAAASHCSKPAKLICLKTQAVTLHIHPEQILISKHTNEQTHSEAVVVISHKRQTQLLVKSPTLLSFVLLTISGTQSAKHSSAVIGVHKQTHCQGLA